jgi:tRNA dimethylallyltransferase
MSASENPVLLVAGPTASGKSTLALALAEALNGVVVNADSMQVYRDLAVLKARPGPAELARAPHRLYGVLDAAELCSAARWSGLAEIEIAAAGRAGRLPILVGGTGLYFRALLRGLAPMPEIPEAVRRTARALHKELGGIKFHALLAGLDPETAARLHPSDSQRLMRAYEVVTGTGRSLGDWQRSASARVRVDTAAILLMPPRDVLYAAIDRRFEAMISAGALDEVRALMKRRLSLELPAFKAVGVPELARHLARELSLDEAIAAAQQASRRYAKRQMTWFRHQMAPSRDLPCLSLEAQFSASLLPEIFSFIRQFLLTGSPQAV